LLLDDIFVGLDNKVRDFIWHKGICEWWVGKLGRSVAVVFASVGLEYVFEEKFKSSGVTE
jgi:hypothetical protein